MDKQAQDRCHRIGQEKTVHIYRLISLNTIEENIFKKSLQKRELGGMIIEGNFNPDYFKKVNYKEVLEESNIMKPRKMDIMKEENIDFGGLDGEEDKETAEAYRRKYEEVLIRIEDQEDVDAYQNAKREIDDEFDEEAGSPTNKSTSVAPTEEDKKKVLNKEEQDAASKTLTGVKRYEAIDWKGNPGLNSITKLAISHTKKIYSFDHFMQDKAEKDSNFVDPEEEFNLQKEREERERAEEEQDSDSSDISQERGEYDPENAVHMYKVAQQEIPATLAMGYN